VLPLAGSGVYRVHFDNFVSVIHNRLAFSLDPGAPGGASIHPTSGQFTWNVPAGTAPGAYPVTVQLADAGSPAVSTTRTFYVVVGSLPALRLTLNAEGTVVLNWDSIAGQMYRLQYKPALIGGAWQTVADVPGASPTTTFLDLPVPAQRFYRLTVP